MNETVTKRFLLYFRLMMVVWILIANAFFHAIEFEYSWLIFLSNIMLFTMEGDIKDRFISVELGGLVGMVLTVLAMLAAVGSAVAQALGGWDVALKVLICFMALDYVTGWLVAAVWHKSAKSKTGALDSKASYKGLVKKGIMLALVWMAALLDQATHSDFVRDAVCLFFIANEGLSVLENTAVMGVPYPAFVKNMLDALHQTGNQGKGTEART